MDQDVVKVGQSFLAIMQLALGEAHVEVINIGGIMTVCCEQGPIYISREQAMAVYDLVPRPTNSAG